MSSYSWDCTQLWKLIGKKRRPSSRDVRVVLESSLPSIHEILKSGGTAPKDFTLHDEGHAFRVAQIMAQIIPDSVLNRMSVYELALLLLGAYLHDIGMTPRYEKVDAHNKYLLTGNAGTLPLSSSEVAHFREWVETTRGLTIPLVSSETPLSTSVLDTAQQVITHYCRSMHNAWSEEFIRKAFAESPRLGHYENWVDDLVTLCKSHHEGYEQLETARFDPKLVDTPAELVHLRYLAAVLRVADILEFDPSRTPIVLMHHRNIAEGSLLFWLKDGYVSMKLDSSRVLFFSRPPNARLHHAIVTMANEIETELRLVQQLDHTTSFVKTPLGPDTGYQWTLSPFIHRDIDAGDKAYVYINGAFRPNNERVMELLSGVELYGDPLVAVREAVQNAFDAAREQMGRERLNQANPSDIRWEKLYSELNCVTLEVNDTPEGAVLLCIDTGVGMTEDIITNKLLVSGSPPRAEVIALEKRCENLGIHLGRTARFGIGALSYFMLADRVLFRTRRSLLAGGENTGWVFETEGLGDFGELRRDGKSHHGTELCLHLKTQVVGDSLKDWYEKLRAYLDKILVHIPCRFELRTNIPGCTPLKREAGWVRHPSDWTNTALDVLNPPSTGDMETECLPSSMRRQALANAELRDSQRSDAAGRIGWLSQTALIPGGIGRLRVSLPYFELDGGPCLAYLSQSQEEGNWVIRALASHRYGREAVYAAIPVCEHTMSWKGMRVDDESLGYRRWHPSWVEVDWHDDRAGKLLVSRHGIKLSKEAQLALDWVDNYVREFTSDVVSRWGDSPFAALSHRIIGKGLPKPGNLFWPNRLESGKKTRIVWQDLEFPLVCGKDYVKSVNASWLQRPVQVYSPVQIVRQDFYNPLRTEVTEYTWNHQGLPPQRVVLTKGNRVRLMGLWSAEPTREASPLPIGYTSAFPPAWTNLMGADLPSVWGEVWNPSNPVVKLFDRQSREWLSRVQRYSSETVDPLQHRAELLSNPNLAAAWIVSMANSAWWNDDARNMWNGLRERDPSFLPSLWSDLFEGTFQGTDLTTLPMCFWTNGPTTESLNVLLPDAWRCVPNHSPELRTYLPEPDVDWVLEVTIRRESGMASSV